MGRYFSKVRGQGPRPPAPGSDAYAWLSSFPPDRRGLRLTRATSVPSLVFLGLSVLDLGPMYATGRQTSDVRQKHRLMPPPIRGGHNNDQCTVQKLLCLICVTIKTLATFVVGIKKNVGDMLVSCRAVGRYFWLSTNHSKIQLQRSDTHPLSVFDWQVVDKNFCRRHLSATNVGKCMWTGSKEDSHWTESK